MAEVTSVNSQITDAVSQSSVAVLGEAPAMAMANIYQSMAHSTGLMFANAVNSQQQLNLTSQASTTMGVTTLYSLDTAATGVSTKDILSACSAAPFSPSSRARPNHRRPEWPSRQP